MDDHHEYCTGGFSPDDIVITGISGRFPHCETLEELKEALLTQKLLLTQSNDRFEKGAEDLPFSSTGTIQNVDKFDAEFFGFASTVAHFTEPLQRMILEVSYEAIADAGYDPTCELKGSNIGVYAAVTNDDSRLAINNKEGKVSNYMAAGFIRCMVANRCSFSFDFHGPSYTVDTACSSSMVALHNAVNDLRDGRVDAAVVNAGELCLSPTMFNIYLKSGILSPTAESNPYDARANGFVRSEGIVAFFLQKASQARRAYASVMAIEHVAAGHVPEGVYVPSHKEEVKLFKRILEITGLTTQDIQFVESHGTGTQVGDPIEIRSLETVYCPGRDEPLYVGSVKSNLGHSEAAAGLSGTLKAILALETGLIAPNRGFEKPNPKCEALLKGTIQVVTEPLQLTTPYMMVNSFGFGGSIVQAALKKNPIEYPSQQQPQELPRLVLFPATTEKGVLFLFEYIENHPQLRDEFFALINKLSFCPTLLKPFRGYALLQNGRPVTDIKNALREKKRDVWFIMTGMGCQWPGMGLEMMQIKSFAESMRKSTEVLKPLGIDLFDLLREDRKHLTTERSITHTFVSIAAIQIALVDVLRTLDIHPDGIIGHSVGELICAYADGCCTAEQTILSAYWRGRSVESAGLEIGAMAAVGLTWEEAVRRCPKGVYPACHNAEDSVTISGQKAALEKFVTELQAEDIFARVVNTHGYGFHCELLRPASQTLKAALNELIRVPKPRTKRWISTSYPENEWDKKDCKLAGAEYFVHNLMSVVRFKEALEKIPPEAITIEIGPHFLLQSVLKRSIGPKATYVGLMKRNDSNNIGFFLESLGKLYVDGLNPKIEKLYRPVKFPVPRGTPFISDLIQWDHSQSWTVPKWVPTTSSYTHNLNLDSTDRYLLDHFIDGKSLFPAAGFVYLAWQAFAKKLGKMEDDINVIIEDFKIHRATLLDPSKNISFDISILKATGKFEIMESGFLVSSGRVYEVKNMTFCQPPPVINRESSIFISGEDIYNELKISGYEYGPAFRSLVQISFDGKEGSVEWKDNWIPFLDSLLLFFMFSQEKTSFVLPIGALSFKICPSIFKSSVKENLGKNVTALPVNFHSSSNICRTTGVEIRSLDVDSIPLRVKSDSCMFEEYRFVPYMFKHSSLRENRTFQMYMISCNTLIDELQSKMNIDLSREKFPIKQKIDFDIDSYMKDWNGEPGLLSTLKQLTDIDNESSALEKVQDISMKYIQEIGKDFINTLLLNEYSLRYMFDIIAENSFKTWSILEIQNSFTTVLPSVVETIENCSRLKFKSKSLVCRNEEDIDKDRISDCKIELYMHRDLSSVAQDKSQGIIISAICTSTNEEARKHMRLLSSVVEQKGFILLFHKACTLSPETFLATLSGQTIDVVSQTTLESWFVEENLVVISKISNNICGSVYLLRRRAESKERKIIDISQNAAWFEDLKFSVCNDSETLWVVSEDCPDSGIIGMINCLRHEPGGEKVRCVYIPYKNKEVNNPPHFTFDDPFYQVILEKDLVMNVYKDGSWGSFKHSKIEKDLQKVEVDNSFVRMKKHGDLSSFEWTESALKYLDVPDRDLVHVYYSSLNFRDVMLATGKISQKTAGDMGELDNSVLGLEFSGMTKHGERVAGICRSRGLATTTKCIPDFLINIPDDWSLEEAATVPVVYATCYTALIVRGGLQPGESVLIHSGTGGIGLAAINIALSMNCEIYTTVGTEEKRRYLMKKFPSIKVENIGCSRDTTFEIMIMERTNGKGVDLVLNSLADEKFQASIRCVGNNGRFVEIGKYDLGLDHKIGLKFFLKNISFHAVLLDNDMANNNVSSFKRMRHMIIEGIKNGVVKPLDRTVFQRDEVEKAFRYMAGGTHIGKVMIKIRDEDKEKLSMPKQLRLPAVPVTYFYSHKVYIIIGGLGGFGIEVSKWLLEKGAKNIVLTSRYGARTPYHHYCLKRWTEEGYHVTVSTRNVAIIDEAAKLLEEVSEIGPVGGIFNSAVVLRDAFLENSNLESFKEVCAPKADATKHLDALSRYLCPELDHFVCFSSISCGRGNAGQMNYGYANSVMERICEQRRADGLPGLAIQWGIIGDVGVVQRHMGDDAMIAGVCAQRVKSCLDVLSLSCQLKHPVVCSYVISDSSKRAGDQGDVLQQLARIFGLKDPSEFNSIRSFSEMGVDSMIGIEVKHLLETACDVTFTVHEIQDLKIDDVKMLLEKAADRKSESQGDGFVITTSANLPKSFVHSDSVERLNDVQNGSPVFILDIDSSDLDQLHKLGQAITRPAFALLLSKEAPSSDVPSLASWFLQKIREITQEETNILAHKSSSVVALEMVLQSQKCQQKISNLTVLDGVSSLLALVHRETKKSELDIFCDFVECHISSPRHRIREQLSVASNFEQKLRVVVDIFTKSSKETVDKNELSAIITSHVKKLQILEEYEPIEKLGTDLLVIEDSSKLLANDVAEMKILLAEVCTGKVIVQRVRDILSKESIQNIVAPIIRDKC